MAAASNPPHNACGVLVPPAVVQADTETGFSLDIKAKCIHLVTLLHLTVKIECSSLFSIQRTSELAKM